MSDHPNTLRRRQRALEATGNPYARKCVFCKQYDKPGLLYIGESHIAHRKCRANYMKKLRSARARRAD